MKLGADPLSPPLIFSAALVISVILIIVNHRTLFFTSVNSEALFKNFEIVKSVGLFFMLLSVESLITYQCEVPFELVQTGLVDPIVYKLDVPYCNNRPELLKFNLTEVAIEYYDKLCAVWSGWPIWGVVLCIEVASFLIFFLGKDVMFETITKLVVCIVINILNAILWGIFEVFEFIEYVPGFICSLPALHYITRAFVICNFFLAVLCILKIQTIKLTTKVHPVDQQELTKSV